ncbi:ABC transporter ATP-binding protein [Streptomyces sp. NPDC006475]|uniref:ABC transporter ATP-binding protein n=1 Tax=Streptomyces sp. NPDC006475 TaxID=3155719 RepID=UPI0033AA8209
MIDFKMSTDRTATWRYLAPYIKPYRNRLVVGVGLSLLTSGTALALPMATKILIENLESERSIVGVAVFIAIFTVGGSVVSAIGSYNLGRIAEAITFDVRRGIVGHVLRLKASELDKMEPGDLISRIAADSTLLRSATTYSLVAAITSSISLAITFSLMAALDFALFVVTLLATILALSVMRFITPRIKLASQDSQAATGKMSAALERAIGSLQTVQAAGAEGDQLGRISAAAKAAMVAGCSSLRWTSAASASIGLAMQLAFLGVLTVGGSRAANGLISVGTLIAFLMYVFLLTPNTQQLVVAVSQFKVSSGAVHRIQEVYRLSTESIRLDVRDRTAVKDSAPSDPSPASVTFQNVYFRYSQDGPYVHSDLTFKIPGGGITAIVGESGVGKSSIFLLLEKFRDPTGGVISVDGIDINEWDTGDLRKTIGYVQQDCPLISGSIRENLTLGLHGVSDDEMLRVLRVVRLEQFVSSEAGLDSPVGDRGNRLSGGERQRLALARALIRRPRILLLDEVTSQVDTYNETALCEAISRVATETTVLVIAHRISTIQEAQRVLVVDGGKTLLLNSLDEFVGSSGQRSSPAEVDRFSLKQGTK